MSRKTPDTGGTATSPRAYAPGAALSPVHVPGWEVAFHARLDSTNLEAGRLVSQGLAAKQLVLAETQTNGQCRHDRLWESPPGKGIWASFILPVAVPLDRLPQSTLVLAVAVREGIATATGVDLEAKWPNDLLGEGKKCCGLLVETAGEADTSSSTPLILGVGINCNHAVVDFPPYLRERAVSLAMLAGGIFRREDVLTAVAAGIARWFRIWEEQGFSPVREAWLAHNCTLGKTVLLPEGYGYPQATARDLDSSGALITVTKTGEALLLDSGEIRFPGSP